MRQDCPNPALPAFGGRAWLLPLLACAAVAAVLLQWRTLLPPQQWLAGGLLGVAAGLLVPRAWRAVFGPVLFYDLMRTARRGRYILLRVVYGLVMLAILWSVYVPFERQLNQAPSARRAVAVGGTILYLSDPNELRAFRLAQMVRFAEAFFSTFMLVQLGAVVLLTPAYTAGAIADEKDRKTLEFLFATDLDNREIVLGKLVACMANVGMLVITGLPILSLMQLLGGVEPSLMFAGYAATGLTVVSLASVSMLVSVYSYKARDAIVLSYLCVLAYLMLSFVAVAPVAALRKPPASWAELLLADLLELAASGNLFILVGHLKAAWDAGTPLTSILAGLLTRYAAFHGLLAVVSVFWAVSRLRVVGLAARRPRAKKERTARHWLRPHVGRQPMLWKEIYAEPGMMMNWAGKVIVAIIVVVSFAPPLWVGAVYLFEALTNSRSASSGVVWNRLASDINIWVRIVGTTVACLTLLGVAVRAAGSVTGEHDRDTLDNLLTTPLDVRAILYAKWLGSVLSVRWAWVWLSLVWGLGVVLGGLDAVTLPWLFLLWLVYAGFFAILGQRFSITRSTTLRATLVTLATLAALTLAHWLPRLLWEENRPYYRLDWWDYVLSFQAFALTPPLSLSWFAFHANEITGDTFGVGQGGWHDPGVAFGCIVLGLLLWGSGAAWLWHGNQEKFAAVTGRQPNHSFPVAVRADEGWGP